jgi:hypothetical protein
VEERYVAAGKAGTRQKRVNLLASLFRLAVNDLRSTAKTHLLLSGANPSAVDVALGHALPGMSGIYVQLQQQPALLYRGCFPTWKPKLAMVNAKAS